MYCQSRGYLEYNQISHYKQQWTLECAITPQFKATLTDASFLAKVSSLLSAHMRVSPSILKEIFVVMLQLEGNVIFIALKIPPAIEIFKLNLEPVEPLNCDRKRCWTYVNWVSASLTVTSMQIAWPAGRLSLLKALSGNVMGLGIQSSPISIVYYTIITTCSTHFQVIPLHVHLWQCLQMGHSCYFRHNPPAVRRGQCVQTGFVSILYCLSQTLSLSRAYFQSEWVSLGRTTVRISWELQNKNPKNWVLNIQTDFH